MNRLLFLVLLNGLLAFGLGGCIDRYVPDVPPSAQSNLVVDGFINPRGSTVIKLSRTFSVNTQHTAPAETQARVFIQDDAGRRYPLAEGQAGTYTSAGQELDPARQYQLRIITSQDREYFSDPAPVTLTPPIDTLTWELSSTGGLQIYLSTHDAPAAARHYRWDYEETWEFTSAFYAAVEYMPGTNSIETRPVANQIFTCWRTEPSVAILQTSTTQFSENTLANYPLLMVPPSNKLHIGYSLLVRQYAQPQAEYEYWEQLRKNTENLGTVNDPLPARVTGNVHALADAAEPVLGYVGVHSVAEKRLFVAASQLPLPQPPAIYYNTFYEKCEIVVLSPSAALQQVKVGGFIPMKPNYDMFGRLVSYDASTLDCVDCRQRGVNKKPSYWPQ